MPPSGILLAVLIAMLTSSCSDIQRKADLVALDPRNSVVVGENVPIPSRFAGLPVVEPHLSAHPSDNNHLLVAAMVVTDPSRPYESCRLSSFLSKDGGRSWKETAHDWWDYDPWTSILTGGLTAMSWIGTHGAFRDQYPVVLFSSTDGGESWNDSVQTLEGGFDGTKIAGRGNEFYLTTVRFRDDMGADVMLYRREGGGRFEEVARIDGQGERLNFCEPAILSDGTVIVPASRFLEQIWVQSYDHATGRLSAPFHVSDNAGGRRGYMRLTADANAGSAFRDRVYFVRAMGSDETFDGIWLNVSTDRGTTWSADRRVDLFETPLPSRATVASAAVNKDGVLGISWVDSQHDPSQEKNDLYVSVSLDGGASFQRPERVTSVGSNPRTERNDDVASKFPGGGHYLNIAARPDGSFQLVWSDSRSGVFELQTCNVTLRR